MKLLLILALKMRMTLTKKDNRSGGEEGDKSNEGKPQTKSAGKHYWAKDCKAQLRKEVKFLKGDQSGTICKPKRLKRTRHDKWELAKVGHEDEISRIQGKYILGKIAAARAHHILKFPGILHRNS